MDLQITGTNIKITDPVRKYIERKLGKLNKHWPNIMEIKAEIAEQQTKSPSSRFLVRVTVDSGHGGVVFHAEDRAEDQLKAIDKVSEVLVRQLESHKGKKHDKISRTVAAKEEVISERLAAPPSGKKVVKVKNFLIKPMSLQEAIDQMELLGHDFFLFVDADSEGLKLVYRRKDGDYGLIEPRLK